MNGTLSFNEFRLSGGYIQRWRGDSNPTWCYQICFELFALTGGGDIKHLLVLCYRRVTWWNFHYLIFFILYFCPIVLSFECVSTPVFFSVPFYLFVLVVSFSFLRLRFLFLSFMSIFFVFCVFLWNWLIFASFVSAIFVSVFLPFISLVCIPFHLFIYIYLFLLFWFHFCESDGFLIFCHIYFSIFARHVLSQFFLRLIKVSQWTTVTHCVFMEL